MPVCSANAPERLVAAEREQSPFQADARAAIARLGPLAHLKVPTATTMHFGQWLDWPDWLRDGTTLEGSGPLPKFVSVADDLLIIANLLQHAGEQRLLECVLKEGRQITGPVGALATANAPTLGEALRSLARMIDINGSYFRATIDRGPDWLTFGLKETVPLGRLSNFMGLMGLIVVYKQIASTTLDTVDNVVLQSTYPDGDMVRLVPYLQCAVIAAAPLNAIMVPVAWADKANASASGELWVLAGEKMANLESARRDPGTLAAVHQRIADSLTEENRAPVLKQIAKEMNLSARTIARTLEAHGTSFHAIVEQERRVRAAILMANPSLSLPNIGAALGFSDVSSFGRSFRKWFGVSPGRYRKTKVGASGMA